MNDLYIPLVTIGIINTNCKDFLETCVESYINQSYKNIEIIIVDDCSTDGSVEILKGLEEKYKNIRCIYHTKNSGGPSQGIQEVIKEARGKYFQWIASDDYVDTNAISKFVDNLENTENDYVYCNFNVIDNNNAITGQWNYNVYTPNEIIVSIFSSGSCAIPMNGLYRLDFFKKRDITWCFYKNNDYSSDTVSLLYFIKNGFKYNMINEYLIYYRIHHNNCSRNIEKRIKTSLSVYDFIIKNFNEEVYIPNIPWDEFSNRAQLKNYIIAYFYYIKIVEYMEKKNLPNYFNYTIDKEKLKKCVAVFIEEGLHYINEGLAQGDSLKHNFIELENKYKSLN